MQSRWTAVDLMQDDTTRRHAEPAEGTDPAAMLALIRQQQRRTENQLFSGFTVIPLSFGAAWLLGYAVLFLTIRPEPLLPIGQGPALSIYFVLLGLASVCTWFVVARSSRGLRGASQQSAAMYGISWMVGMVGIAAVLAAVMPLGVSPGAADLLWSAAPGLMAGMLLLSGGAVFSDIWQYGLGLWIVVSTAASAFAGIPHHYLVMSLAGGGGLIVFGVFQLRAERRADRAARQAGGPA
ncbi:hypothetical protein FHR81_005275 [Actinoalloteichus hoggarensis]|nr:hypothetical protein [Actinoalloteichus hoggarensis]MBB5924198.1 hypothetical protein [Actinoalloteichus hoggarensis]